MSIKLLQLNIYKGLFFNEIVSFIEENNFDILHLQEVSGGSVSKNSIDCFDELIRKTSYNGHLVKSLTISDNPKSYFGNATFYKKELLPISNKAIWLKPYSQITRYDNASDDEIKQFPRSALDVVLKINSKNIHFINTHLAWGNTPLDEDYKLSQAQILADYVRALPEPFVLSGDFNVTPETILIKMFDSQGANLITKYKISNTLNPNIHRAKHLFPEGIAVDYIFTSSSLAIRDFRLVDKPDLSDHFGLIVEIEV